MGRTNRWIACSAVLLLCLAAVLPLGCGKSEPAGVSEEKETASEVEEKGTEEERTAGPGEGAREGAEAEEREPGTETGTESISFSLEGQTIGSGGVPGLVITDVRWSDHADYYRIVFELHKSDGTDVSTLPLTQTWYDMVQNHLLIFVLGPEVSDPQFDEIGEEVHLGDPKVRAIKRVMGGGSMETTFVISTSEPLRHYLHFVTGPLRVILDIEK